MKKQTKTMKTVLIGYQIEPLQCTQTEVLTAITKPKQTTPYTCK